MPVAAKTENGEIKATSGLDRLIELPALRSEIRGIAAQQAYVCGLDRKWAEQVLPQESAIAVRVVF